MGDGMLHDILAIERQIEAEMVQERARAEAWLTGQKEEIDRQTEFALKNAASVACQTGEARCQGARRSGAKRIRAMRRHVRELKSLSDARLRQVLQRHITRVTGGVQHDYPDG